MTSNQEPAGSSTSPNVSQSPNEITTNSPSSLARKNYGDRDGNYTPIYVSIGTPITRGYFGNSKLTSRSFQLKGKNNTAIIFALSFQGQRVNFILHGQTDNWTLRNNLHYCLHIGNRWTSSYEIDEWLGFWYVPFHRFRFLLHFSQLSCYFYRVLSLFYNT